MILRLQLSRGELKHHKRKPLRGGCKSESESLSLTYFSQFPRRERRSDNAAHSLPVLSLEHVHLILDDGPFSLLVGRERLSAVAELKYQ